jgi:CDP-diacylglycerol--glycerol-3-phosphate 3-phosphatidyltransferase
MAASNDAEFEFNTAPNWLTLFRMLLVPFLVAFMSFETPEWDMVAVVVFVVASITDYFDGYIARAQKSVTIYGKLMDPLADKFLVSSALIMLLDLGRIHAFVVILLICREIAITGLRALASAEGLIISASDGGKWKTVAQMVAIPMLILNRDLFSIPLDQIGMILLYVSLLLSLLSAKDYIFGFFRSLAERRRERRRARKLAKKGAS